MFRKYGLQLVYKTYTESKKTVAYRAAKYRKLVQGQVHSVKSKQNNSNGFRKIFDNYKADSANLLKKSKGFLSKINDQYERYTPLRKYRDFITYQKLAGDALSKISNKQEEVDVCDKKKEKVANNKISTPDFSECLQQLRNTLSNVNFSGLNKLKEIHNSNPSNGCESQIPNSNVCSEVFNGNFSKSVLAGVAVGSVTTNEAPALTDPIPEPPPIPENVVEELPNALNALGEPTFASLGLGGWTPVGVVQNCLEFLHVSLGIPWWEAIVIGTIVIRTALLPLVIISQRNAARMNNYLPQMQALQLKLTEARQSGNELDAARYSQELMIFMKEKGVNPLKNMVVPLAQMPIFISFFMALREMASTPVDSLKTGGLFWFKDLTVPDQFFAMPIITSLTLWATIELGTDSAKLSSQNMQIMSYVLRALPLVILPFTVNFPGAVLCYWVSSNFISLLQVAVLRMPGVRDFCKIERLINHDPNQLPIKKKGFKEGLKESWTNVKISKELEERKRLDEIQFQRAGKGPVVKTYKYDPTKQVPSSANAVSAKKR